MKKLYITCFTALLFIFLTNTVWGQTNPETQSIPYVQDFSGLPYPSSTYPAGWQGWTISLSPGSSYNEAAPIGDRSLSPQSTAATTSGNVHNYNGKIGYLNSSSLDLTIVLAINTTGKSIIQVSYDIMTIRNPYDGVTNTRINEVTLQYRVGTTGTFVTLTGIEYQNNTTKQISGTTPQNPQTKLIILPSACNNQTVVQLRWASRQISGDGSRPSFAVDNIVILETIAPMLNVSPSSLSNFSYVQGSGPSASQDYTLTGSNLNGSEVIVTGSTNYEVSKDNTNFSSSVSFTNYENSFSGPVYVRLKAGLTAGLYENETISNSGGGAATVNVTVSGKVLSPEPTQQPTNLSFSNVGTNSMTINWTKAAGTKTIVLMKSGNAVNSNPVDETTYTGNAVFGSGSQIGTGNYVVYAGDLETIDVTGLSQSVDYYVALYSYNGSAGLENYLITGPLTGNQTTSAPTLGWQITSTNTAFSIDFDNTVPYVNNSQFSGSGFTPNPTTGQLNSNTFRVDGLSDGTMTWGESKTSGDFARGTSLGGVSTGGIYSFTVSTDNNALGVQPTTDDFTSGNLYLRVQNKTGFSINSATVFYKVYIKNDQDRGNIFNFSYSTDDNTYYNLSSVDLVSWMTKESSASWRCYVRSKTITGINVSNNQYLCLRWNGDDFQGSDNRDEFALDDISIIFNPSTTIPSFSGNFDEVIIDCNTKLSGNTTVDSTLTIRDGLLFLGSNLLTVNTRINLNDPGLGKMIVLDDGTNQGTLKLRVNNIYEYYYFHIGDSYESVEYSAAFIKFNSGIFDNAYLTVSMKNLKHPNNNSESNYINRYWNITPEGITNYSYDIQLFYAENDIYGDEQYMILGKYNGTNWQTFGSSVDPYNNKLSTTGLTSFSDFTGGTQTGMPVHLAGFSSSVNGRNVILNWITDNEENNAGFEVQKSEFRNQETEERNGQYEWKNIGFIQGQGNSKEPVSYNFEDKNLSSGKYKYRLKQIDYNGNYEYFELENEVVIGVPKKFELAQNYPNPFNPVTNINFDLPEKGLVMLKIYDLLGREVTAIVNELKEAGFYTVQFNAGNLSSGIYFYRLSANGMNKVKKLVVIK